MKLKESHFSILNALADGSTLKSHRDIDGNKIYRLHALDGTVETPSPKAVEQLKIAGHIDSNKKFPAATYLLTDKGRQAISVSIQEDSTVVSARNYVM